MVDDEFLDTIYTCVFDDNGFDQLMDRLGSEFDGLLALYLLNQGESAPETMLIRNISPDDWCKYEKYYYTKDPCVPKVRDTPYDRVFSNLEYFGDVDVEMNEHINDFVRPVAQARLVNAIRLNHNEAGVGILVGSVREIGEDLEAERLTSVFETIRPHLQRAIRLREKRRMRQSDDCGALVAALDRPAVLVDACGCIMDMNAAASNYFADHVGLVEIDQRRSRTMLSSDGDIKRALLEMERTAERESTVLLQSISGQPMLVKLICIQRKEGSWEKLWRQQTQSSYMIIFGKYVSANSTSIDDISSTFGLSKTERLVALRFALGLTLDEIAVDMGVSRVTARNHLANIMAKAGVSRQTQLVKILHT